MSCGIYRYTNLINGKRYIGQAKDIDKRYFAHLYNAESNNNDIQLIDKAIRKYGINNFRFEILEFCEPKELNELEKYWIYYYNTNIYKNGYGYNLTDGGDGFCGCDPWNKGKTGVYTEEQIKRISKATKLAMAREDVRKRYIENRPNFYGEENGFYGKHHSEETKKKISDKKKGKHPSEETRKLFTLQRTGKKWMNNGIEEHLFTKDEVNEKIKEGFVLGRLDSIKKNK